MRYEEKRSGKKPSPTEIGSEFWDIPLTGEENGLFPPETEWFLSGRDALRAVIRDIQKRQSFHSVGLPSWCCDSMIEPFLSCGVKVHFYTVTFREGGGLHKDFSALPPCDVLLLMDYFGYESETSLPGFPCVVIWDATHSICSEVPPHVDYVFGSLRKWAGFWTGGFAWRKDGANLNAQARKKSASYVEMRQQAMEEKKAYLAGQRADKGHLVTFSAAERLLEKGASGPADARDIQAAKKMDIAFLRQRRRENAACLLETLSGMAMFPRLEERDCPLFVPIRVPDGKRDALQRFLIEREIYCPAHWPVSALHELTGQTRRVYEEELSLICDQRYDQSDMERIRGAVFDFFERER